MAESAFQKCSDVRCAVPEDADNVLELCWIAAKENAEHSVSYDKVRMAVERAVARDGALVGVIGDVGKPLKGFLLMCVAPIWYSNEFQLMELVNFVHPAHRRSDYAKQLIAFGKGCSDTLELDLMIGVFSSKRTEEKIRLYERQLPKRGAFFCYRHQSLMTG